MIAAGRAAERGRKVLLLEKNSILGKKLLITGGGRCNITNNQPNVRGMLTHYKKSDKFLFSAFTQFGVTEAVRFFKDRGVPTKEEAEGRMFPVSNTSKSVLDALVAYMKKGNVTVRTNAQVREVTFYEHAQQICVRLGDTSKIYATSCVVATGGISHPETGSTGEGFAQLRKLGHTIIENDLSLVPIRLQDAWAKKLAGVTLSNIKLTTYKDGVKQKSYKGKILFTHVGISGPTVLNMSREVGELLTKTEADQYAKKPSADSRVTIALDLFPSLDMQAIREKLKTLLLENSNKKIKNTLSLLVPPTLVSVVFMVTGIDGETPNHSIRAQERKALLAILKDFPLNVKGLLGKDKAVISSGGVALHEVNFKTMQSRLVPRLYVAGDVLNIDRPSGGYSLQLCWTTGYIAGSNC